MFKLENILKGLVLTIFGLIIMAFSFYWWAIDEMTDVQALGAGAVGFALMYMRSKLDDLISTFFGAMMEKFKKL
jgi:hypothetical protein